MTMAELRNAIQHILPRAQLDEDMEGQIIIYTDMMCEGDGGTNWQLVPYVEQEEGNGAA
jgi:hypothetical protein